MPAPRDLPGEQPGIADLAPGPLAKEPAKLVGERPVPPGALGLEGGELGQQLRAAAPVFPGVEVDISDRIGDDEKPDALIHLQTVDRSALLGGRRAHDEAVVGAQALFGAIRRCKTIKHVIVKSDLCVYGMGPRNPSVVFEDAELAWSKLCFLAPPKACVEGPLDVAAVAGDRDRVFAFGRTSFAVSPARDVVFP